MSEEKRGITGRTGGGGSHIRREKEGSIIGWGWGDKARVREKRGGRGNENQEGGGGVSGDQTPKWAFII